jgi:hypothetical protein
MHVGVFDGRPENKAELTPEIRYFIFNQAPLRNGKRTYPSICVASIKAPQI